IAVVSHIERRLDQLRNLLWSICTIDLEIAELKARFRNGAHRDLPRIELGILAAHGDEYGQREAGNHLQRQRINTVANAARLHQQYAPLAAEPTARDQTDAFLL